MAVHHYRLTNNAIYLMNFTEKVDNPEWAQASSPKPRWDSDTKVLSIGGVVVKRFRVPADNQIAILEAFKEEGWPDHIFDPMPPQPGVEAKQRLRETVRGLNKNQVQARIKFLSNGTGNGVIWKLELGVGLK